MSQKTNLLVDISILAGFLVAFEPSLTGITVHEWFTLAFSSALRRPFVAALGLGGASDAQILPQPVSRLAAQLYPQPGIAGRFRDDHAQWGDDLEKRAGNLWAAERQQPGVAFPALGRYRSQLTPDRFAHCLALEMDPEHLQTLPVRSHPAPPGSENLAASPGGR